MTARCLVRAGPGAVTSGADTKGQASNTGGNDVHYELVDGDYQIIVHVIEARDLKPVDTENGTRALAVAVAVAVAVALTLALALALTLTFPLSLSLTPTPSLSPTLSRATSWGRQRRRGCHQAS